MRQFFWAKTFPDTDWLNACQITAQIVEQPSSSLRAFLHTNGDSGRGLTVEMCASFGWPLISLRAIKTSVALCKVSILLSMVATKHVVGC